jgi:hypothetical protein
VLYSNQHVLKAKATKETKELLPKIIWPRNRFASDGHMTHMTHLTCMTYMTYMTYMTFYPPAPAIVSAFNRLFLWPYVK